MNVKIRKPKKPIRPGDVMKGALDLESEDLCEVPSLMLISISNMGNMGKSLRSPCAPLHMYKMNTLAYMFF